MKKAKRNVAADQSALDWEEFAELHALQNRLEELLMSCEGIAIGMSLDFVFEVWGKLRFRPGLGMARLAAAPGDLREAVRLAYEAAHAMEMGKSGALIGAMIIEASDGR